jgi:hypothetical protein
LLRLLVLLLWLLRAWESPLTDATVVLDSDCLSICECLDDGDLVPLVSMVQALAN